MLQAAKFKFLYMILLSPACTDKFSCVCPTAERGRREVLFLHPILFFALFGVSINNESNDAGARDNVVCGDSVNMERCTRSVPTIANLFCRVHHRHN